MDIKDWKIARDKYVIEKYQGGLGYTPKEIAGKLGMDENLVRQILDLKGHIELKKIEPKIKSKSIPKLDHHLAVSYNRRKDLMWLIMEGKNKEASALSISMYFK